MSQLERLRAEPAAACSAGGKFAPILLNSTFDADRYKNLALPSSSAKAWLAEFKQPDPKLADAVLNRRWKKLVSRLPDSGHWF